MCFEINRGNWSHTMGRSWSLRNSGPSFVFLNFRNMRTDTMAATTTNADTSPARSGSVDTLLSRNTRKKENREWERELYLNTFWKIICKYCVFLCLSISTVTHRPGQSTKICLFFSCVSVKTSRPSGVPQSSALLYRYNDALVSQTYHYQSICC